MSGDNQPLRILFVGMLPPHHGGSAISGAQLLQAFCEQGHRVCAVAPIRKCELDSGDDFAAAHPLIRVNRYIVPHTPSMAYSADQDEYIRQEGAEISRLLPVLIAEEQPDLILLGREAFAVHVPQIARRFNIPCVLRAAGATTFGLAAGYYSEDRKQMILRQLSQVDQIITPARHMAPVLEAWVGPRVRTIMNAVDIRQFAPRPPSAAARRRLKIAADDLVVCMVGGLHRRKRPLDLVYAAEQALKRYPRLLFVMVGAGVQEEEVRALCRERGVAERFRFAGWVDYQEVPRYINLSDFAVMCTEGEGLARVYLEAQACGKLLVTSDIAPAHEVVRHGETGLLFRLGDVADLTEKLCLAAGDAELRARIGRQARQAVEKHTLEDAVPQYIVAFREAIEQAADHVPAASRPSR